MSKITYLDKEYIYENDSIPEINKTTDGNMNEIKSVVNENDTRLSTVESDINNLNGKILWTNPNPTSDFSEQDTSLTTNNCDVFDIYYLVNKDLDYVKVERIKNNTKGVIVFPTTEGFTDLNCARWVTTISNSLLHFNHCIKDRNYIADNLLVPIYIIGYKTGLFS